MGMTNLLFSHPLVVSLNVSLIRTLGRDFAAVLSVFTRCHSERNEVKSKNLSQRQRD